MERTFMGLGAKPSPKDLRDHTDKELAQSTLYPEKYKTDISTLEMRMQHFIGKCVGSGTAKRIDSLFPKDGPFSDDFLYRGAKTIEGNTHEGTSIRYALNFAQNVGSATQKTFNIPVTDTMTYAEYMKYEVPKSAYDEAPKYKIGQYKSIPTDIESIKAAIYKYGILVIRLEVGEEWWKPSWNASDILPLKSPKQVVSGHCVVLYGYDSTLTKGKTALYMSNSWSSDWADKGNAWFYYENYKPTEAWAVTLDPVPKQFPPFDMVMKLVNILIRAGIIVISKFGVGK